MDESVTTTRFKLKVEDATKYRVTSSTRNVLKLNRLQFWARLLRDKINNSI